MHPTIINNASNFLAYVFFLKLPDQTHEVSCPCTSILVLKSSDDPSKTSLLVFLPPPFFLLALFFFQGSIHYFKKIHVSLLNCYSTRYFFVLFPQYQSIFVGIHSPILHIGIHISSVHWQFPISYPASTMQILLVHT